MIFFVTGQNANVGGRRMTCTLQFSDVSANTQFSSQHEGNLPIRTRVRSLPNRRQSPVTLGSVRHSGPRKFLPSARSNHFILIDQWAREERSHTRQRLARVEAAQSPRSVVLPIRTLNVSLRTQCTT